MTHSRNKGKAGEREVAAALTAAFGPGARRTSDGNTQRGRGDVIHPSLPDWHIEVKRAEQVRIKDWIAQAEDERDGKRAAVVWRTSRMGWRVDMSWETFVQLLKEVTHDGHPTTA